MRPISTPASSKDCVPPSAACSTCVRRRRSRRSPRRSAGSTARSMCSPIAPASCTTAPCSTAPKPIGIFPSGASAGRGLPNRYVYGATKAAVIGLTKAVAADFIKRGIRANAICPGTIQSPSLDERIAALAKSTGQPLAAVRQNFVDRQPMGRLGTPQEVAVLAVYLASDESSFTTGQIHLVDGGFAL